MSCKNMLLLNSFTFSVISTETLVCRVAIDMLYCHATARNEPQTSKFNFSPLNRNMKNELFPHNFRTHLLCRRIIIILNCIFTCKKYTQIEAFALLLQKLCLQHVQNIYVCLLNLFCMTGKNIEEIQPL